MVLSHRLQETKERRALFDRSHATQILERDAEATLDLLDDVFDVPVGLH
mgnify:FL=1|jgi:hypothetical protein